MTASSSFDSFAAHEGYLPIDGAARLYYRLVGKGRPLVVLHGGPDFDHFYLLPEMDRLAGAFRLVYYDQRGRGRSAPGVEPEDVGIDSEIEDLERLRRHLELDSVAVLGHSWGGVLAMEYATRHPERVSHLILLNTAPASGEDVLAFREELRRSRPAGDVERMQAIAASPAYGAGDLAAESEYYRLHFAPALRRPEDLDRVVPRLRAHFTSGSVLTARAIEDRLYEQTWETDGYDLVARLRSLDVPTLVLHGAQDFIPAPLAARIGHAMPRGRVVVLEDCGHFAYLESPEAFTHHVTALFEDDVSGAQAGSKAAQSMPK